jgi:hypothetical protein
MQAVFLIFKFSCLPCFLYLYFLTFLGVLIFTFLVIFGEASSIVWVINRLAMDGAWHDIA